MPNVCPKCQSKFTCDAKAGKTTCWCMDLPALIELDEQADCFCPSCLAEITAQQQVEKQGDF